MLRLIPHLLCVLLVTLNCSGAWTHKCYVNSDPPGAHVSVAGEYQGDTPCWVKWDEGDYVFGWDIWVTVSKEGYLNKDQKVQRKVKQLYFVLDPVAPDRTQVSTPQQQQQMQQQMSGPTIVITGGQTATGQQAVEIKEYSIVSLESIPSGAEVYEGSYFLGNTPISKMKFQAGPHSITISLPGYKPWVRQLMVITNSEVNIKAQLEKSE